MFNDTSVIYSNLQTLSKTSQSVKPFNNDKLGLPSKTSHLNNNSNKLHHLADVCILKILES